MAYLELRGISKQYLHHGQEGFALSDIDLAIEEGEFVTIVGSSGSGKSTLLGICSGLIQPTHGDVLLGGQRLWSLSEEDRAKLRRRMMGQVFQDYRLLDYLDVSDNVRLPLILDHQDIDMAYLDFLLERLNLTVIRSKYPLQLSGGERQRVAIARALAGRPRILLADEPTGNLDLNIAHEVMGLLHYFSGELGLTTLLVTHDPHIATMGDRTIHLEAGRMLAYGSDGHMT